MTLSSATEQLRLLQYIPDPGLDIVFFGLKLVKAPALWPAGVITCAAIAALACSVAGIVHARAPRR